jgi:transcription elongation factor/antiterminator RfaH
MEHWYALYTKPKKEHQVDTFLRGQGIVTYLPTQKRKVRRRDRPDDMVFFPCYLFARLDLDTRPRSSLDWMPGVRRIVSMGDQPVPVSDDLVALIQARLCEKTREKELGYGEFKPGDRVRVLSGPFHDLDAIFERPASGPERVRVLLEVMGRTTPVEVSASDIEKTRTSLTTVNRRKPRNRP